MNEKILLVGGGGHCKSVLDSLLETKRYSTIAIIDRKEYLGREILGVPIIGCDKELPRLFQDGFTKAFITVGSIGNPKVRIELFNLVEQIGYDIPNIIDPSSKVSNHVKLGKGIYIGKHAVVNAGAEIQNGAIVNSCSLIEHDCLVEAFAHIAPGSVLCGEVVIGEKSHIGANSVIKQQVKIGSNSIIGIGSVVLHHIKNDVVAFGNPCKEASYR